VLSNDSSYWTRPSHGRSTGASAFRLYEGETISGLRQWGSQSPGTAKHRPNELLVRGSYTIRWNDYSRVSSAKNGTFRWMGTAVGSTPS